MRRRIALALIGGVLALLAAACGGSSSEPASAPAEASPTNPSSQQLIQVNEARGITLEATWVTSANLPRLSGNGLEAYRLKDYVLVLLAFTTHSGDLSQYDLAQLSSLRINGAEAPVEAWVSLSDDSHHREGVLIFARPVPSGPAELVLKDIGGEPQRVFRWETVPEA